MQSRQFSISYLVPNVNRLAISLACAAFVSAGVFAAQSANAQSTGGNQVSSLGAQATYDDQTLQSFAAAAAAVLALRGQYYPRIRAAEFAGSKEKADLLFKEMREQMHAAIGNSGFSTEQYRAISSAAKTDAVLRQRINSILQGPKPAQRHIKNVVRPTPKEPEVAAAPSDVAPATRDVAPATPQPDPAETKAAVQPADDGARLRLEAELNKANAERDRYRAEQTALQEKTKKLERQLSAVKAQDSALRQQLNAEKAQALAEQKKTAAELNALLGEVTGLKGELATVQSRDSALREQLETERARADAEQRSKEAKLATFRREIKRLAGRLSDAQQALDMLAVELKPGEYGSTDKRARPFEPLAPLRSKPNSIERVLAKTQPQYALRQELNSEIAQIQKERVRRDAERTALQQEIAELSRDLAATYQAIAELIGEPSNTAVATAEWDIQNGTYALDLSQETAQLFEAVPTQFGQTLAGAQASMLLDEPLTLDIGDSVIKQSANAPADSATLEPGVVAPLRENPTPAVQITAVPAPAVVAPANPTEHATWEFAGLPAYDTEISIAEAQPIHQIVRDDKEIRPEPQTEVEPDTADTDPIPSYSNSVRGGVEAYRAADFRRAYEIWAPLSESGNRDAQFYLGALYFEGRGTGVDFAQAYFWLRVSAYQGNQRALTLLTSVAEELTSDEIRTSDDQARDWLQKRSIEVTQFKQDSKNRL